MNLVWAGCAAAVGPEVLPCMLCEQLGGSHPPAHATSGRAAQEENLRAGLLLEQAAHSLLRLAPSPHTRKFAFHLVLAGLRYNLCGQKELALRAYKWAAQRGGAGRGGGRVARGCAGRLA